MTPHGCPESDLLLVCKSTLDAQDLHQRIQANQRQRRLLPPLAASLGRRRQQEQRRHLLYCIRDLQQAVRQCGRVRSRRTGWLAQGELLIKRCLRKLFARHLLQQQRVQLRLIKVLNQLAAYLEDEDQCLRAGLDYCEQRSESTQPQPSTGTLTRHLVGNT
jgi:hypothetical protein